MFRAGGGDPEYRRMSGGNCMRHVVWKLCDVAEFREYMEHVA